MSIEEESTSAISDAIGDITSDGDDTDIYEDADVYDMDGEYESAVMEEDYGEGYDGEEDNAAEGMSADDGVSEDSEESDISGEEDGETPAGQDAAGGSGWVDPVAIWHNERSNLGFADGHAEKHRWVDQGTIEAAREGLNNASVSLGDKDIEYMRRFYPYDQLK